MEDEPLAHRLPRRRPSPDAFPTFLFKLEGILNVWVQLPEIALCLGLSHFEHWWFKQRVYHKRRLDP